MLKTAIFGGTFNPPHNGHIAMLSGIADLPEIEKILVMPANIPPHKAGDIAAAHHRVNMCKMAFNGIKKAEICLLELELEGKNYTLNTLKRLKERSVQNPVLVIGADSLINFDKWYEYEQILNMAELYVYPRQGMDKSLVLTAKAFIEGKGGAVTLLNQSPPGISSTLVRDRILNKKPISDFVPSAVAEYIKENGLYNGTNLFK